MRVGWVEVGLVNCRVGVGWVEVGLVNGWEMAGWVDGSSVGIEEGRLSALPLTAYFRMRPCNSVDIFVKAFDNFVWTKPPWQELLLPCVPCAISKPH